MENDGEKLLLFGGIPSAYLTEWEITSDLTVAEKKLGVRFEEVANAELVETYESLDEPGRIEASRLARKLINGASGRRNPDCPPEEDIEKATRLYTAMKKILEARAGDALTIVCEPWTGGDALPVPCVALMLFQEQSIPAACQGDIDALLTMILFKRVANLPSFMGGAIKARGHLGINHCSLCRRMLRLDSAVQPYEIRDYHRRKSSPTVWTSVPSGETVTIARLTRNLERLLLTTGTLVGCQTDNWRCRNTLVIQVEDRNRIFRAVKGGQNHYVVACGNHTQVLTELAEAKGIDVVSL